MVESILLVKLSIVAKGRIVQGFFDHWKILFRLQMKRYTLQLQFGSEISKLVYRVAVLVFRDLYFLLRIELPQLSFIRQFLQGLDFLSEFTRNWNIVCVKHHFQFLFLHYSCHLTHPKKIPR